MDWGNAIGGITGMLGGLFGDSGAPFEDASRELQKGQRAVEGYQQPYMNAGQQAIPAFQNWLQPQSNPSMFINNLMNQYQASPYSQYLQNQGLRTAQNMGSASGLTGSTPLLQFAQQNAGNIASSGMNDWLSHVLGINTQYGAGQQGLIGSGQNAANALTNYNQGYSQDMANMAYGKGAAENKDWSNVLKGAGGLIGSFFL